MAKIRMYKKHAIPQDITELVHEIASTINQMLRENIYETALSEEECKRLEARKKTLRRCLKNCATGDKEAKQYVKEVIKDILLERYELDDANIGRIIDFNNNNRLSNWDKFQIVLYIAYKAVGEDAINLIFDELDINGKRCLDKDDLDRIYYKIATPLEEIDKLEIIVQRIYSLYRGLGIADDIRDMNIDGISGGVSGNSVTSSTLWIFKDGVSINLSFLNFQSQRELERICNNIYRNNQPGHLSKSRGYIVNDMSDHSRVVVARPPFCENWVFFVRKFNKARIYDVCQLYGQSGCELLKNLLLILIRGCVNCAITGAQGSGKTTLLMALINYIDTGYNLRIQELAFELHLRDIYPDRNIVTFRETDYISGQEGLDLQKKTDGAVNILGEVASAPVAGWMIQMGLTASLFTLFTHHAKTTKALVSSLANALLSENIYQNELAARKQVVDVVKIDIHLSVNSHGERYVERISEICNMDCSNSLGESEDGYFTKDIIVYNNGRYIVRNKISQELYNSMKNNLSHDERQVVNEYFL